MNKKTISEVMSHLGKKSGRARNESGVWKKVQAKGLKKIAENRQKKLSTGQACKP